YLALEPYVLIGCALGVGLVVGEGLYNYVPPLFGVRSLLPTFEGGVGNLINASTTVATIFDAIVQGTYQALFVVLGYVWLRLTLRRSALAIAAGAVLFALVQANQAVGSPVPWWLAATHQAWFVAVLATGPRRRPTSRSRSFWD